MDQSVTIGWTINDPACTQTHLQTQTHTHTHTNTHTHTHTHTHTNTISPLSGLSIFDMGKRLEELYHNYNIRHSTQCFLAVVFNCTNSWNSARERDLFFFFFWKILYLNQEFDTCLRGKFSSKLFMYTLNSEPKALTGDKSEGIKSRGVAEAFIRGFIPS